MRKKGYLNVRVMDRCGRSPSAWSWTVIRCTAWCGDHPMVVSEIYRTQTEKRVWELPCVMENGLIMLRCRHQRGAPLQPSVYGSGHTLSTASLLRTIFPFPIPFGCLGPRCKGTCVVNLLDRLWLYRILQLSIYDGGIGIGQIQEWSLFLADQCDLRGSTESRPKQSIKDIPRRRLTISSMVQTNVADQERCFGNVQLFWVSRRGKIYHAMQPDPEGFCYCFEMAGQFIRNGGNVRNVMPRGWNKRRWAII